MKKSEHYCARCNSKARVVEKIRDGKGNLGMWKRKRSESREGGGGQKKMNVGECSWRLTENG